MSRVCRWLLEEGLATNHKISRNWASGTFCGRTSSNNPFLVREQSVYLFWHTTKSDARRVGPLLGAPRSTQSYSPKGRPLHRAAPPSLGNHPLPSGQASGRARGAAGAFGPVGRAQAAHWTLSGCWDNRPQEFGPPSLPLGEKGTELARPAAWLLFQPPGERES